MPRWDTPADHTTATHAAPRRDPTLKLLICADFSMFMPASAVFERPAVRPDGATQGSHAPESTRGAQARARDGVVRVGAETFSSVGKRSRRQSCDVRP